MERGRFIRKAITDTNSVIELSASAVFVDSCPIAKGPIAKGPYS